MVSVKNTKSRRVPISLFNRGMAGAIFRDVRKTGFKVVVKDKTPECVLLSPEKYEELMDELEDARLLDIAMERMSHYDPDTLISQEEIDREFGFTPEMLKNLDEVEIE